MSLVRHAAGAELCKQKYLFYLNNKTGFSGDIPLEPVLLNDSFISRICYILYSYLVYRELSLAVLHQDVLDALGRIEQIADRLVMIQGIDQQSYIFAHIYIDVVVARKYFL